jgi:hypothetical protein
MCQTTQSVPTTLIFLIISTAKGAIGGGNINPSTLPQTHQVDYLRVVTSYGAPR